MIKAIPLNLKPLAVFNRCIGQRGLFFLDSSLPNAQGRFSYIGFDPVDILEGKDLDQIRRLLKKSSAQTIPGVFTGGAVGYLSYDGRHYFGVYDQVLVYDHERSQWLFCAKQKRSDRDLVDMLNNLPARVPVIRPLAEPLRFSSSMSKADFIRAVRAALQHIHDGDIYQINLSRRIEWDCRDWPSRAHAAVIYQALRQCSPSPFAAYFEGGPQTVLSSSPERFLKLQGRMASVRPMKGTRPRGQNPAADAANKEELRRSEKERAELLMVTDLERNDLGRVCDFGSVKVKHMRTIEAYQQVFQATSTVEGRLRKDCDAVDLIRAAFPSGSVTGCPKIAAMNVIRSLEHGSRGLYTGALGYISFNGDMDFSVLIRSLFLTKHKIVFHAGSGIVADSDPAAEYEETCLKAKAMEQALRMVFERD